MTAPLIARDGPPPVSPMTDAEERLGIEPLEGLLDERRHLTNKVATLRAKYGSFGTADHIRKIELSRLKCMLRVQALREKRKVTADQVDAEAHAHADYVELVTLMTNERAEWVRLENSIDEIDAKIMRGQAVARFVTGELRL